MHVAHAAGHSRHAYIHVAICISPLSQRTQGAFLHYRLVVLHAWLHAQAAIRRDLELPYYTHEGNPHNVRRTTHVYLHA